MNAPKSYAEKLAAVMSWPVKRAKRELEQCAKDGMSPSYIIGCAENGIKLRKKKGLKP